MKNFKDLYTMPTAHNEHVMPADVNHLCAETAAHLATRSIKPKDAGAGIANAIVTACYGTPHAKAIITSDKRSATARLIIQAWPKSLPVCNNSKDANKRRPLTANEFTALWSELANEFDRLATYAEQARLAAKEVKEAEKLASTIATVEAVSTQAESAVTTVQTDRSALFAELLKEALTIRALPKALKERISEALAA